MLKLQINLTSPRSVWKHGAGREFRSLAGGKNTLSKTAEKASQELEELHGGELGMGPVLDLPRSKPTHLPFCYCSSRSPLGERPASCSSYSQL